jgi:hypothetical protein
MRHLLKEQTLTLSELGFYLSDPISQRSSLRCCALRLLMLTSILFLVETAQGQSRFTINCSPTTGPSQVGLFYSANCVGSGGITPYRWSINSGSLPAGLTLNMSEKGATISGTPTSAGDYGYLVEARDGGTQPQIARQSYSGVINPQISLTCDPPTGPTSVTTAYASTCGVSGGKGPYSWSISSGSLPIGLTLIPSVTSARISGTPEMPGNYNYTLQVKDAGLSQEATRTFSGTIAPQTSIQCNPATGPTTVGTPYTTTCNPPSSFVHGWSISQGSLPAGLTLSTSGSSAVISGTPTAPGNYNYTVRVTFGVTAVFEATQTFTGTIGAPISLTCNSSTGPSLLGTPYSASCSVSGGTFPYRWSIGPGSLPAGLTLVPSGNSATISGTPALSGNYNYTVRVTDNGEQSATQTYSGTIIGPLRLQCDPSSGPTMVGIAYTATCTVSGGAGPYNWSIGAGTLPSGLTLNVVNSAASVSGTPRQSGKYDYTIRVTDNGSPSQVLTQTYVGTIAGPISLQCDPRAGPTMAGEQYSATCTVSGGAASYSWSISAGALPNGLTLNSAGSSATISGTPTSTGDYGYTVRVIDSSPSPQSATQAFSGTISQFSMTCGPATGPVLVGTSYSARCSVSGGTAPYNWTINPGPLPTGLTLNPSGSTAVISGTPTVPGSYSYAVRVSDSGATPRVTTQAYNGTINPPVTPAVTIMIQPASAPTQPLEVGLQLSEASPVPLQGTLSLTFRTLAPGLPAGYSDPALQFVSGGRTAEFVIPAGATSLTLQNRAIQQGTVAGDITVSVVSLRVGTADVTPQPAPSRTVALPILPPVITPNSVRITTMTANTFDVEFTAYSTPRDLTEARYTFDVVSGTQIVGSATVPVDVRNAANAWYASSPSQTYGSQFLLRMRFTVEGDPNSIASVTVTLSNSAGTSSPVIGRR